MAGSGLDAALGREAYGEPALTPILGSPGSTRPAKPSLTVTVRQDATKVSWKPGGNETVRWWVLQSMDQGRWTPRVLPATQRSISWKGTLQVVAVSGVDRYGQAGLAAALERAR